MGGLSGQVPETIVSGETADISPFAAFKWYQWIMYRDTTASFPDDKMVLGRDLGPAIDVGPAMTRKVLKSNGQTIYRSTVRALTDDEMSDEDMKRQRQVFNSNVRSFLGVAITPKLLWDDCLEREAYVRSLTALDIYGLSGQVPETIVSGKTADISPFAAFKWYQWIM